MILSLFNMQPQFLILIFYSCIEALIKNVDSERGVDISPDHLACGGIGNKYILNVTAHVQADVGDEIQSMVERLPPKKIDTSRYEFSNTEKTDKIIAIYTYLGMIVDELNYDLEKFKVELNLKVDGLTLEDVNLGGAGAVSCELGSPVDERIQEALTKLKSTFFDSVGFHVYIFGCLHKPTNIKLSTVVNSMRCGRVAGIIWHGYEGSVDAIKSGLLEAISGVGQLYDKNAASLDTHLTQITANLCDYFHGCVSGDDTIYGKKIALSQISAVKDLVDLDRASRANQERQYSAESIGGGEGNLMYDTGSEMTMYDSRNDRIADTYTTQTQTYGSSNVYGSSNANSHYYEQYDDYNY